MYIFIKQGLIYDLDNLDQNHNEENLQVRNIEPVHLMIGKLFLYSAILIS